jgi:hypothetical protein
MQTFCFYNLLCMNLLREKIPKWQMSDLFTSVIWIPWLFQTKALTSKIHFRVKIHKAHDSAQANVTFLSWVMCMLISAVNEQTQHCNCFLQDGQRCFLLASKNFIFFPQIIVYQVGACHSVDRLQGTHSVSGFNKFTSFSLFLCSPQKCPSYGGCLHTYACRLHSTALSSSEYEALNGRIMNNHWKGCGRKWKWSKWRTILAFAWREWGTLHVSQLGYMVPCWHSNWSPLKYKLECHDLSQLSLYSAY